MLQLRGTFPIFLHRTHHCLHVQLGVSQAVFAIKGTALAPGGSSSCLSTAARSWGRFGMPDENSKGHVSEAEGHTPLGGKTEPFNGGKFSPAKDLGAPNLLPLPNTPTQNMALGFLPRPQQWDSCCSPSLCLQSEEHRKCYIDLLLINLSLLGGANRGAGEHRNPSPEPHHRQEAGAAASCYLTPESLMLTRMPRVSSLPPRLLLLLWPAGRQEFWKSPKERLHPCVPQSLPFPPNSCLKRLCQNQTSGCPAQGGSPPLGNVAPNPVAAQVEMLDCKGLEKP